MDLQDLAFLPMPLLVILGSAYAAYRLAYSGRSRTHQFYDSLMIVIIFAATGRIFYDITDGINPLLQALGCAFTVCVTALIWRAWLAEALFQVLRALRLTTHDGTASPWETLSTSTQTITQICVIKKDGSMLSCNDTSRFVHAPYGPGMLGADGSIALYMTHYKDDPKDTWHETNPLHDDYGARLTFIPYEEVGHVTLSIRSNASSKPSPVYYPGSVQPIPPRTLNGESPIPEPKQPMPEQ